MRIVRIGVEGSSRIGDVKEYELISPRKIITRTTRLSLARISAIARLWRRPESDGCHDQAPALPVSDLPIVPRDRRLAVLRMLQASLTAHDVDYRIDLTDTSAFCAVDQSGLDAVCKSLNALGRQCGRRRIHVWLGRQVSYDAVRYAEDLTLSDIAECDSIIVAAPFQVERLRVSRSGGVEILVIEQQGVRYVAKQRRAAKVDWTSDFRAPTGFLEPRSKRKKKSDLVYGGKLHALEEEPIDVVYTWVNSSEPEWDAAMREWAERQDIRLASSSNDQRYLNRDELRYSLRSIWLYAPYIRNIFLVTAGHCPRWLNRAHDNIRIVPHREIFPCADDLPTFNSHAIETCLHRIPGLSEHFIYFNDDVLLNRETSLETFFTKAGLVKCRFSKIASIPAVRPDESSTPTDWASYNASAIICRDFGIRFDRKLKHVPMAMKRSLLYEIEDRYYDVIADTRRARFRSSSDLAVPSMLAHFYGISVGKAVEWEHVPDEYIYADTGRADFEVKLDALARSKATFICINATRYNDIPMDRQNFLLREFLEKTWPLPSPYELIEAESESST